MKKVIIIVLILVALFIIVMVYNNYKNKQNTATAEQNFNQENTTGSGLLSQLSGIWTSLSNTDKGMTEKDALALSVEIADLKELESETATNKAIELTQTMYNGGWSYVGYNEVEPVSVKA